MDVVLMMFSHAEGTTLLGTHKLEQFIVTTELCGFSSMMSNRPPLYRPALDCTVANDFVSTEFERYIDLVEDNVSIYVLKILSTVTNVLMYFFFCVQQDSKNYIFSGFYKSTTKRWKL